MNGAAVGDRRPIKSRDTALAQRFAAWPRQARLPRFRPIRVRIGPPLHFGDVPDTRDGWSAVGQRAEAAVVALASG